VRSGGEGKRFAQLTLIGDPWRAAPHRLRAHSQPGEVDVMIVQARQQRPAARLDHAAGSGFDTLSDPCDPPRCDQHVRLAMAKHIRIAD
jgi:hypothetical protein